MLRRIPHPDSLVPGGPEIDAGIISRNSVLFIEAKWQSQVGDKQGKEKDKDQIQLRGEFLNSKDSLRQIAEKHKLSVNGLKKVLRNFTYIGKIKFNNQVYQGDHKPIISMTLFNHVQNKLERLGIR